MSIVNDLARALTDEQNDVVYTAVIVLVGVMIIWFAVDTVKSLATRVQGQHEWAYHTNTFADDYLFHRDPHSYDTVRQDMVAALRTRRRVKR